MKTTINNTFLDDPALKPSPSDAISPQTAADLPHTSRECNCFHPGSSVISPLQHALERFNKRFRYDLRTPIEPHHVELAAEVAEARGERDLALALRLALRDTMHARWEEQ